MLKRKYNTIWMLTFMLALFLADVVQAQSAGGMSIQENGFVSVFGEHSFAKGSGLIGPGMIKTARTGEKGYLNFVAGSSWTGAAEGRCVDGYVRVYHNESFIFPIGTAGKYRPVAISAGGAKTTAAYFDKTPATLNNGQNSELDVDRVSNKEYWDIKGDKAVSISFLWTEASDVSSLTGGQLGALKVIGMKNGQWEVVPSIIDEQVSEEFSTKFLGITNTSGLTSGTITTSTKVVPNDYEYFTLGAAEGDAESRTSNSDNSLLSLYPNPVTSELYVNLKEVSGEQGTIKIYNLYGKLMEERAYDNTANDVQHINTSEYLNGMYKIVVRVDNRRMSHKFVVNRLY